MEFVGTFWALIPPIAAIVLALITKETYVSLLVGIVCGALILAGFDPVNALNYIIYGQVSVGDDVMNVGIISAVSEPANAGIFVFLVMLGIMVALVNSAGGSAAFGKWAAKHIKSRSGAALATFLLGVLIFIDDYFNCLTVGAVMRPVTDEEKISRAKLSYIIDATAAPICMISPISSWAAAVSATASDLNNGMTGIQLFIQAIPYNFYSLLTIVFVIGICIMGFDYGPMARAELEAYRNGNLGSLGDEEILEKKHSSLWDMIVPVILLIVFCVIGMMYAGGFWDPSANGYMSISGAFEDTSAYVGLPWGSFVALVITFFYLIFRRVVTFSEAASCIVSG
ncbi:MAG: Na+/H+ antiporter NhaC family protein, partial [Coriobacteriales bacterium]